MYDIILKIHSGDSFLIRKIEKSKSSKPFFHVSRDFNKNILLSSKMFFSGSTSLLTKYISFVLPSELSDNKALTKILLDNKSKYITLFYI